MIGDEPIADTQIDKIIDGALMVVDGCSSSHGLQGWKDIETVTSQLMYLGALSCIVNVLPVKHDPIISEELWGELYSQLRGRKVSVGQALNKARTALREHFEMMDSKDPAWLFYQLIGNPSVKLLPEEKTAEDQV